MNFYFFNKIRIIDTKLESKENKHEYAIGLKVYKKSWGIEKIKEFKKKIKNLNVIHVKNKSSVFFEVKIPISLIFYVEYFDDKVKYHFRSSEYTLVDDRNIALSKLLQEINSNLHKSDIWSNFIRIKSYYLVRQGDIKGYDNSKKEVFLSSITHCKKIVKLSVSPNYKKELFENINFISKGFLLVKSIDNIEYIIYPYDIRLIESHSKSKKIFLENNLFTNMVEVKLSKSSNSIKNFFLDEFKILFNYGIFIQLNRSIIFNLIFFDKNLLDGDVYNDLSYGKIKINSKPLKELN